MVYIGLISFGIYQLQPTERENPRLQHSGCLLAISGVIAAAILLQGGFANGIQRHDFGYVLVVVWALVAISL